MNIKKNQIYTLPSGALVKVTSQDKDSELAFNCVYQSKENFGEKVVLSAEFINKFCKALA